MANRRKIRADGCKVKGLSKHIRYYQYIFIDEASRERFYSWLTFYSLEDLRKQGVAYLKRPNRI